LEFRKHTLDNGLEIVAECNGDAHTAALGFFVKTGARDETAKLHGVSHFLEHMVFKGTPRRTAEDVNREFDEMGAYYNAFTSEENTVFYAAVLSDFVDRALRLLSDLMRPSLRSEDFETEKKVIVEEIRMYEDQPPFCADEICKQLLFDGHALGRSVLGTVDSVEALSVEEMRDYFRRRYSPANLTLVGAGRLDFDQFVEQAAECCAAWESLAAPRAIEPAKPHAEFRLVHKESATQEYLVQLTPGPSATDKLRYAAKVLTTVIGDDSGSRMYWKLVDSGLAEHVSQSHHEYLGAGLFMTYMSCDPGAAEDNLNRIEEIYREVESQSVTPAELEQARRKISARIVLGSERPRNRLFSVGANWVQRREYRAVHDDLRAIEAVSLDDLNAVLSQWPLSSNATVLIGPLSELRQPRA